MIKKKIDIVLPCYNPNGIWYHELISFYNYIKNNYDLHFIVVNDGSDSNNVTENIKYLVDQNIPVTYISYVKNMGKGYALRQGVLTSNAEFIIYTDIDFPFTNQSTALIIETLVGGNYDVVAGFRDQKYYLNKMTTYRKLLSKAFRFFIKTVLKMTVTDTQCGLKGFNRNGKKKFLGTTINRYLFDFEFIYASGRDRSISLKTIEVQLKDGIIFSKMKLKVLFQEIFNLIFILVFKRTQ